MREVSASNGDLMRPKAGTAHADVTYFTDMNGSSASHYCGFIRLPEEQLPTRDAAPPEA